MASSLTETSPLIHHSRLKASEYTSDFSVAAPITFGLGRAERDRPIDGVGDDRADCQLGVGVCEVEVAQEDPVVLADQDPIGHQPAVNDALGMNLGEGIERVQDDVGGPLGETLAVRDLEMLSQRHAARATHWGSVEWGG